MTGDVVGRDSELGAIRSLLDDVAAGPAALALYGEAGIGKTTVWRAGVSAARDRGLAVLASRPVTSEVRLSYSGLTDLVVDVDVRAFELLPAPQRRALDAALLRSSDDELTPDPRAVAAGFLSVLDASASETPVLVAIDDLQWLDEPTRRVLAFAARRCRGPIALLWAERVAADAAPSEDVRPPDGDRSRSIRLGSLSLAALHAIVRKETGRSLARPALVRVAEMSGGNPFFASQIASAIDDRDRAATPFPSGLRELVEARVRRFSALTREALLVASALNDAQLEVIGRAVGGVDAADALAPAEDARVIEITAGRVHFTHPLLASGVYARASPTKRRALHRRLSALVKDVEERARHLALGSARGDTTTIDALDAAAERARHRGAPSAAAELLELAIGLGANDPSRRIQVGGDHFHADNQARAKEILEEVIADLGAGTQRAEALAMLGTVVYELDDFGAAVPILEQALEEAGADPKLRVPITLELVTALNNTGRMADALPLTELALREAERSGDDGLLAETLGGFVVVRFVNGRGIDQTLLDRALSLEDPERMSHAYMWPSMCAMQLEVFTHRFERARERISAMHQRCVDRGLESDLWIVLTYSVLASLPCGDVESAQRAADELTDRARMSGSVTVEALALGMQSTVLGWVGDVAKGREIGARAVEALSSPPQTSVLFALAAVGMLELSVENYEGAAQWLAPAAAQAVAMGMREPGMVPFLPDAAEALISMGRLDEAETLIERLVVNARDHGRPWATAVAARCRALLLAARGDVDAASAAFEEAIAAHDRLPRAYDRARTLLSAGRHQRRRNQRRAARASLEQAARLFEDMGTSRWAAAARDELGHLGLRAGRSDALTPTEARIATLAASGMTNREVAARLFLSPKTVESNLSRAYRKLGISSRAELGACLADGRLGAET